MAIAERVGRCLDQQFGAFASYKGKNYFEYRVTITQGLNVSSARITTKIKADLKEFANNVLPHFDKYDIPWLNCEDLGYHLKNLKSLIIRLTRVRVNQSIRTYYRDACIPGMIPSSKELTIAQKLVKIDIGSIIDKLRRFPRLKFFLHNAFYDYFNQMRDSLSGIGIIKYPIVGIYLKKSRMA